MLSQERRERIRREIAHRGRIEVAALADIWGCSEMTIRRDLDRLAAEGALRRVRGGALAPDPAETDDDAPAHQGTLGIIVPRTGRHFDDVLRGATTAAEADGFQVAIGASNDSAEEERRLITQLRAEGVDGLLLAPIRGTADVEDPGSALDQIRVPVVLIEATNPQSSASIRADLVATDHAFGIMLALDHLAANGYDSAGLLTAEAGGAPWPTERLPESSRAHGMTVDPAGTVDPQGAFDDARRAAGIFLDRCAAEGTRAAVVVGDAATSALLSVLRERSLHVPDDFAIVAYGEETAAFSGTRLTTVRLPAVGVGQAAAELCIDRIRRAEPGDLRRVQLLPRLVERDSSRPSLARVGRLSA